MLKNLLRNTSFSGKLGGRRFLRETTTAASSEIMANCRTFSSTRQVFAPCRRSAANVADMTHNDRKLLLQRLRKRGLGSVHAPASASSTSTVVTAAGSLPAAQALSVAAATAVSTVNKVATHVGNHSVAGNASNSQRAGNVPLPPQENINVAASDTEINIVKKKNQFGILNRAADVANISDVTRRRINNYAQRPQTGVSIEDLSKLRQKDVIRAALFLWQEVPVRLAHRVYQLEQLPYGLSLMPSVQTIKQHYVESFEDMLTTTMPDTMEHEEEFSASLQRIFQRHGQLLMLLGKGLFELKQHGHIFDIGMGDSPGSLHSHVDHFYGARIGLRTLIQHQLELRQDPRPGYAGVFCLEGDPLDVIYTAIDVARNVCIRSIGDAPHVDVICGSNTDVKLKMIPDHLFYILTELLKNSMRATVEAHPDDPPAVQIVLVGGDDDVTIKVSDEGGGIPRSGIPGIWSYLYTTADTDPISLMEDVEDDVFQERAPLAGFGCGLPISRCYARFMGGDVKIISLEGYGTDAFVFLPRIDKINAVQDNDTDNENASKQG